MARIKDTEEVKEKVPTYNSMHPKYDVSNPEHKKIILDFERDMQGFNGPWRWELYCISKRYFINAKIEEITLSNGKKANKVDYNYAINRDTLIQLSEDENRLWALKILEGRRFYAQEQEKERQESLVIE